jgi:hypothetical protein
MCLLRVVFCGGCRGCRPSVAGTSAGQTHVSASGCILLLRPTEQACTGVPRRLLVLQW